MFLSDFVADEASSQHASPEKTSMISTRTRRVASTGYSRIRDVLRSRGSETGRTTIQEILRGQGIDPAPPRKRRVTWNEFLRSH